MTREIISIIIILALVISIDIVTQNYTKNTVNILSEKLQEMRDIVSDIKDEEESDNNKENNNINEEQYNNSTNNIDEIDSQWHKRYKMLSYYLEHDELEKVETTITSIKSYIEVKDYDMTIEEIDSCMYLLDHIKDKEKLSITNIF